jgi:hypothetical protein
VYETTDNVQRFGQLWFFVKFSRFLRFVKKWPPSFFPHIFTVMWIWIRGRIGSESHHFLPDPDPDRNPEHADPDPADSDRYQFQADEKVNKLKNFPENFNMLSKILKIVTYLTLMRKIKRCKLALL